MFNRIRAQWYYNRLEHSKGDKFIRSVSRLAAIKSSNTITCLLDILISRNDLAINEKAALAEAFAAIGSEATRFLINSVYDENGMIRYNVVSALGHTKDKEALPLFMFLLEESDNTIFAKALGDIGSSESLPVLRSKVRQRSSHCRFESLRAIAAIDLSGNSDIYCELLYDDEISIRVQAAAYLRDISYKFTDNADQMLFYAVFNEWNLVQIKDKKTALGLLHFIDRSDEILCEKIFERVTGDNYPDKTEVWLAYLQELPNELKRGFLDMIDYAPVSMLDILVGLLSVADLHLKRSAEKLLCRSGEAAGRKALEALTNQDIKNELVRTSLIAVAVETLSDKITEISDYIKKANSSDLPVLLETAAECANPGLAPVIRDLLKKTDDEEIILCSVYALGEIEDKESSNVVSSYLKHKDRDIRIAVYEALRKIGDKRVRSMLVDSLDEVADDEERELLQNALREISQ
ncbi:MAG: HEAT repeat domain-containing protein [Spirochaetes bacterium]|nr:HEAT repeat domain-containing protein [Spirochaetota bacterium]MBN2770923.1 HEAT repeat domain-containing protein [Spirochaetota bacterium]